VDWSDPKKL
jgi:hypothetical protein